MRWRPFKNLKLFSELIFHILFGSSEFSPPKQAVRFLVAHVFLVGVPDILESAGCFLPMDNDDSSLAQKSVECLSRPLLLHAALAMLIAADHKTCQLT